MEISNTINIVTYNHKSKLGIEDLHLLFSQIFIERGFNVINENYLKYNSINIIIDEFTGHRIRKDIQDFKRKKAGLIYIVPTEFITEINLGVRSFNVFNPNFFYKLLFSLIFIFLSLYYFLSNPFPKIFTFPKIKLGTGISTSIRRWGKKKITLLGLYLCKFNFVLKNFDKCLLIYWAFKKNIYEFKRFYSLLLVIEYCDGFIHFHKVLEEQYKKHFSKIKSFYLSPRIDKKTFKNKFGQLRFGFTMSGTITSYRNECFDKLKSLFSEDNCDSLFRIDSFKRDPIKKQKEAYQFSYNPGQSSNWNYSSPTRLYRAINVNHSIPVIDKRSFDSDIEDLAITLDKNIVKYTKQLSKNNEFFKDYLQKIDLYNKKSKKINSVFFKKIDEIS
jgi:hypothetical protein